MTDFPEYLSIESRIIQISESKSKLKEKFGIQHKERFWKKLNGERRYPDGTIVRYVDGYIDGNIYDKAGNILQRYPAVEYEDGKEYWTRGYPDGFPAILQNYDFDQEYWICGTIVGIFDYRKKAIFREGYSKKDYYIIEPEKHLFLREPTLEEINESILLEEILEKITTVEQALSYDNDITFPQLLEVLKNLKNRKSDSDVYNRVHIDKRIYSDIKKEKKPVSFDNGILLAMSFEFSFDEMIKFLSLAGQGFKRGEKREKIIKKYFDKKNFSVFELNKELYKNGLELITDKKINKIH